MAVVSASMASASAAAPAAWVSAGFIASCSGPAMPRRFQKRGRGCYRCSRAEIPRESRRSIIEECQLACERSRLCCTSRIAPRSTWRPSSSVCPLTPAAGAPGSCAKPWLRWRSRRTNEDPRISFGRRHCPERLHDDGYRDRFRRSRRRSGPVFMEEHRRRCQRHDVRGTERWADLLGPLPAGDEHDAEPGPRADVERLGTRLGRLGRLRRFRHLPGYHLHDALLGPGDGQPADGGRAAHALPLPSQSSGRGDGRRRAGPVPAEERALGGCRFPALGVATPLARVLIALAMASFAIGTTEFVIMGLLPDVAGDLSVTVPQAGLLVSGYALGVVFGAPILAAATARLDRRHALLLLIAIFIGGNLLCAIAPSYGLLMGARIVTALCHGAFFGVGAVVASRVVPAEKRAQALALMFTGLTLANVLGVPFGTALGQALGWRATFWAVVAIGLVVAVALNAWLPRGMAPSGTGLMQQARTLGRAPVLLAMLISVLASASLFSLFTYIAPVLETVTRETPRQVTWILVVFGAGLTLGNLAGGRLADWRLMPSVIGIFLWGAVAFALVSPLQTRVVNEASGAPDLASTLNQGAFNLGNAAGAFAGELALTHGLAYGSLPWLGAGLATGGLAFSVLSWSLDRQNRSVHMSAEMRREMRPQ